MSTASDEGERARPLLSLRGINMTFGGVRALKNVSFEVMPGEVHCLAGENGSDTFDFNAITESGPTAAGRDVIEGFAHLVDKINLATIDASAAAAGNQAFSFIAGAAFSAEGQVRAVQSGADTLIQVNVSGDAGAPGRPKRLPRR